MKIRMRSSRFGSEDGRVLRWFREGHVYDVHEALARRFVWKGFATTLRGEEEEGGCLEGLAATYSPTP